MTTSTKQTHTRFIHAGPGAPDGPDAYTFTNQRDGQQRLSQAELAALRDELVPAHYDLLAACELVAERLGYTADTLPLGTDTELMTVVMDAIRKANT